MPGLLCKSSAVHKGISLQLMAEPESFAGIRKEPLE